jgi:hypothetical protein
MAIIPKFTCLYILSKLYCGKFPKTMVYYHRIAQLSLLQHIRSYLLDVEGSRQAGNQCELHTCCVPLHLKFCAELLINIHKETVVPKYFYLLTIS